VWGYTPRKTQALLSLASERHRTDRAEMLAIQALAASGDGDAIKQQLKQLSDEG
jgi:hypothetical protein